MDYVYEVFVGGAIRREWGGPACKATIPLNVHIAETVGWLIFLLAVYKAFNFRFKIFELHRAIAKDIALMPARNYGRTIDLFLGLLTLGVYILLAFLKFESSTFVFMFQPCHMTLLIQIVALLSNDSLGVMLTICTLPYSAGTLLAILLPNTVGMTQLEVFTFWLEHYLAQVLPIYLLTRWNFIGLKYVNWFTIVCGIWALTLPHWILFEV